MSCNHKHNPSDAQAPRATPTLWRSLDERAMTPQFQQALQREFPALASEWGDETSRRTFLKVMGASIALAGVGTGCFRQPDEKIVPYVRQPEQLVPGKPLYFATSITFGGYARGVLVESHEGRPTKIEGNPDHPSTLGASDAFTQAAILSLYDPDRSQTVMRAGEVGNWSLFTHALEQALAKHDSGGGQGLRILTRTITSPTLLAQMAAFQKKYPKAVWHQYDPVNHDNSREGARLASAQEAQAVYKFDQAKVIVSLDDNFLSDHAGSIRYARDFASGRRVRSDRREMNRLYVAESTPTITGAMADSRVRVKPGRIEAIARDILGGIGGSSTDPFVAAVLKDLNAHRGASLVVVGENQPPAVHALGHAINAALGNIGKTVTFIEPIAKGPASQTESLRTLVADMNAGSVQTLVIFCGNPAYDAPSDLKFDAALKSFSEKRDANGQFANLSVRLGSHNDETSFLCHWHLPLSHELETWGDARGHDGTAGIIQPLVAPLYESRSEIEVMSLLLGERDRSGHEIVREHWRMSRGNVANFDAWWEQTLRDGIIEGSAFTAKDLTVKTDGGAAKPQATTAPAKGQIEIVFRPDPNIWDGTFANNGWQQECPKPLTKLTWDNAALMSHATAVRLGVIDVTEAPGNQIKTSLVRITVTGQSVDAPVWILPGQPDDVVTLHLGYGRTRAGRIGNEHGFNAYAIRTSAAPWFAAATSVHVLDETYPIACTQNHQMMEQHGRNLIHVAPIAAYDSAKHVPHGGGHGGGHGAAHGGTEGGAKHEPLEKEAHHTAVEESPKRGLKPGEEHPRRTVSLPIHADSSVYPSHPYDGNKWGMVIDQNTCIGCNACVVACQSENNIPVVGKKEVSLGREMHWLRIDTYFGGEVEQAEGPFFQPLPCMHCENAPCEVVCPVEATSHDAEGLNVMTYNRCIGTRYCSNNCPYKVRRFNFLHYSKPIKESGPLMQMMNPDVTVRFRGVMEKCSFCIQRINHARIDAKKESRDIKDGEVVTACAQACPTQAIYFGNLNDSDAAVTKLVHEPTNYGLLEELQTRPRTTYLPRFTNAAGTRKEG